MPDNQIDLNEEPRGAARWLRWSVDMRAGELGAAVLGFVYYFLVLSSYYVLRPIRDAMGLSGGLDKLKWMFLGTLLTMLVANAAFSAIVARMPRRRFIPIAYHVLVGNLAVFVVLLTFFPAKNVWIGRVFFVWLSVFNLFVVSVFWAFMADHFDAEQGKRLFGFLSVGGTAGAIAGSAMTTFLVKNIGPIKLLVLAAILLELSVLCVKRFPVARPTDRALDAQAAADPVPDPPPVGGGFWNGAWHTLKSPYLLGISVFILLYALTSTVINFQQYKIATGFKDNNERTAFFAQIDLAVNVGTVIAQIFITGRLLKWIGVGATLAILPLITLAGFLVLGANPALGLFVAFLIVRRASNYSFARPAREVLFTVISREDKYKAKNFVDTFIYRFGDQVGIWSSDWVNRAGVGLGPVSFLAAPLAAIWLGVSIWLGRRQAAMAAKTEIEPRKGPVTGPPQFQPAE